jgi:hypothetical protein
MSASVVRRDDLQVLDLSAAVPILIFDANIRKLDVLVFVRQAMRQRPFANLVGGAIWPAIAVPFLSIALLQESLVFALQLVVEDDSPDMATALSDRLRGSFVGPMKVRIVGDLRPSREASVKALAVIEGTILSRVQEVSPALREGHQSGP